MWQPYCALAVWNVTTTREQDCLGQPDEVQLSRATAMDRCILTHNRLDFESLHAEHLAAGQRHAGIIIATRRSPSEIARRAAILLDALTADEIEGQLLYI